jgi:hypothetical protein
MDKKELKSIEDYKNWLREAHQVTNLHRYQYYYEYVTNSFKT